MGRAAAKLAAGFVKQAIASRACSRIIVGTGPSQNEVIDALVALKGVDWSKVEVFHMDEYVGMPDTHLASFRRWLRMRVVEKVHPAAAHYMIGDATDIDGECERYGALLAAGPIDVCFVGFGENGHIAFNDPHTADFHDPQLVKRVQLDERCRMQQVGEGHFAHLAQAPQEAITLTCPALMRAQHLICCVPDRRKAQAVRDAIEGPLTTRCPASLVFTHPYAHIFLDAQAASLLDPQRLAS
ncbi:MAG: glucosamine-6-phosphate deaminase [Phycisphaeraceae bacterium]|nr:glucosamine-6-phosphate deaminase [Phycisphaeraceae bacterium]